jgi:hypothetical protein
VYIYRRPADLGGIAVPTTKGDEGCSLNRDSDRVSDMSLRRGVLEAGMGVRNGKSIDAVVAACVEAVSGTSSSLEAAVLRNQFLMWVHNLLTAHTPKKTTSASTIVTP